MYKVTFEDGSIFRGGNPEDSRWNEMPEKKIKQIEYMFPNREVIQLRGYESYNHVVERAQILGTNHNEILRIYLFGKTNTAVLCYIYNMHSRTWTEEVRIFGKEWYNSPTTGWKEGIIDEKLGFVDNKKD